nr:hypothetical protein CFP56_66127 [Quercus suber]
MAPNHRLIGVEERVARVWHTVDDLIQHCTGPDSPSRPAGPCRARQESSGRAGRSAGLLVAPHTTTTEQLILYYTALHPFHFALPPSHSSSPVTTPTLSVPLAPGRSPPGPCQARRDYVPAGPGLVESGHHRTSCFACRDVTANGGAGDRCRGSHHDAVCS